MRVAHLISEAANTETLVEPASGFMALKNIDDWRALFHQMTPVVVSSLVTVNVITNDQAALWIPLVFAIIDPILSAGKSEDKVRSIIIGVLGVLQTGTFITSLLVGNEHLIPMAGAALTVLSAFMARFYTPTSSVVPQVNSPAVTAYFLAKDDATAHFLAKDDGGEHEEHFEESLRAPTPRTAPEAPST